MMTARYGDWPAVEATLDSSVELGLNVVRTWCAAAARRPRDRRGRAPPAPPRGRRGAGAGVPVSATKGGAAVSAGRRSHHTLDTRPSPPPPSRRRAFSERPAGDNASAALQTSPGVYDEQTWVALDRILAAARDRGLRLLLTLANHWSAYGGAPACASRPGGGGQTGGRAGGPTRAPPRLNAAIVP